MIKKTLRLKLNKHLLRAASDEDQSLCWRALTLLGYEGDRIPSEGDLGDLFQQDHNTNEVAMQVLDLLAKYKGPAQAISPRAVELFSMWQAYLDEVAEIADPEILAQARDLTSVTKVLYLDTGSKEETHLNLYAMMAGILSEYNEAVGLVAGVTAEEFELSIKVAIEYAKLQTIVQQYVEYCADPASRSIRARIAKFFEGEASLMVIRLKIEQHMLTMHPLAALTWRIELAPLFRLIRI